MPKPEEARPAQTICLWKMELPDPPVQGSPVFKEYVANHGKVLVEGQGGPKYQGIFVDGEVLGRSRVSGFQGLAPGVAHGPKP